MFFFHVFFWFVTYHARLRLATMLLQREASMWRKIYVYLPPRQTSMKRKTFDSHRARPAYRPRGDSVTGGDTILLLLLWRRTCIDKREVFFTNSTYPLSFLFYHTKKI